MHTYTKHMLIVSLGLLCGAIAAVVFFALQIRAQGETLRTYVTALDERSAQEESYARIAKLVQETEFERATLGSVFFTDDGEAVSLLTDIEQVAADANIKIKTTSLEQKENKDEKTQQLFITFTYSGSADQVHAFTEFLETLPYHSWLEQVALRENKGMTRNSWEGEATLVVTIKS